MLRVGCWDLSEQEQRRGEAAGQDGVITTSARPASLLLPPEPACSASSLCCSMSTQRGTCQGKGTVPWLPGFNGAARSGPCLVHREWDCMFQHSLPQPWKMSGCWRLWSPACIPARSCQKWETSCSSSASPAGASRAAKCPGLVLPCVDPCRRSWSSPCSLSAGNKGPFLADEWAQCVRPPARPHSPRPAAAGQQGRGQGYPAGTARRGSYSGKEHGPPSAQGRLCAMHPRAGAPLGTAVTPNGGMMAHGQRQGSLPSASPPCSRLCPTPCPLWGQLCGVALEMPLLVPCHWPPRLQP